MSCWVAPTIAAELWGVSVEHILQRVRDGDLAHRSDEGFMFVEVGADAGSSTPSAAPIEATPPIMAALSAAEVEALRAGEAAMNEATDDGAKETQSPDDDEASLELEDWRAARARVAMTRTPPHTRSEAA